MFRLKSEMVSVCAICNNLWDNCDRGGGTVQSIYLKAQRLLTEADPDELHREQKNHGCLKLADVKYP